MTTSAFRRAVVTGGAGFVGSHLCDALLATGCDVVCIDNFSTGSAENVAHLGGHPGFTLQVADATEAISVPGPVDLVLHFASPASPLDYHRLPVETMRAGSFGTFHTLNLALTHRARYLFASTSESYGDPEVNPQPESYWGHVNPVGPRSVYDEAKRFGEALTMTYRRVHQLDAAVLRIFNTYGPRMRPFDGRVVPTFVRQALAGEPLTVAGDGTQTRSLCYVDDLVRAVLAVAGSALPGPVNIGNPQELSVLDIARRIIELTGSSSPIAFIDRPVDDPGLRQPDLSLISASLGWRAEVGFDQGLGHVIRSLSQAQAA